ncbi:MAG: ORF6N domain-containing protein [Prevotellaceae bacterium]|nr:ORF6N domain-containing protein [Prevotellaceae bacterium]
MSEMVKFSEVEEKILTLRNQQVILDSDVAVLYGVETREINQALKNNQEKFPEGYVLQTSQEEKNELIKNFDNPKTKFSPALPKAFTEKGLYMLATILKSDKATQTTIAIVETFAKIRELARTVSELSETNEDFKQKSLMQKGGEIIADILDDSLKTTDTETTIELNFALMRFKHTIKRKT